MPNYNSIYKGIAGHTVNWVSGDSLNLYNKNLINRYDDLKKYNWINNHFTYAFNSLGFRCNEFTHDPTIMFLGCSYTMGIGLPVEYIWPELVSKNLNMNCANLGICGSSPDTAFRLCHGYIDKIKPKVVIFMLPPGIRCENVNDDEISNIMVGNHKYDYYLKIWGVDENNDYFNREKNILGIKMLCHMHNIKLILVDHTDLHCGDSLSRDLMHRGIECNDIFSKKILGQI
jgi:hypothetical protein